MKKARPSTSIQPPAPLTEENAQVLFDGFNECFFHGRISSGVRVRFKSKAEMLKLSPEGADACWRPGLGEIWVRDIYKESEQVFCILLLHEMLHAMLEGEYVGHPGRNRGHGMIYQVELWRLIRAGAYDDLF